MRTQLNLPKKASHIRSQYRLASVWFIYPVDHKRAQAAGGIYFKGHLENPVWQKFLTSQITIMSMTHIYSHPLIHRQYCPISPRSSFANIDPNETYPRHLVSSPQTRSRRRLPCQEIKSDVDIDILREKLNSLAFDQATYTRSRDSLLAINTEHLNRN
jgi:hypothetical protein